MSDDISEIVRQLRTGEAIDRTAIAATLERLSAGKEEAFQWADKFKARAEAAEARLHRRADAMSDEAFKKIETGLLEALEMVRAMTPEEIEAQRQSWVRGMTTPCEHGEVDFEECPKCRAEA